MEGENNERALEPVGEIRPWRFEPPGSGDLSRQEEMKIERKIQKRIKSPGRCCRLNQASDEW